MQYRLRNNILLQAAGDEYLALDGVSGACHVLNDTAGWLLSLGRDFVGVQQAVTAAVEQYEIEDAGPVRSEIEAALEAFAEKGLIEIAD